jgi:leucyl/phenylalanyl-tRNA---protein transferase
VRLLTPDLLLRAYAGGIFPMADAQDAQGVFWVDPKRRGILPLDGFRLSGSLAKLLKSERFEHSHDRAFAEVMHRCAESAPNRPDTWINAEIFDAYCALHAQGDAHSVEVWQDGELAGGLYGVRIGGAFFGESMFSRARDASKAALAHLVARLRSGGFTLLDTQFLTPHLASLGGVEVPRDAYRSLLASAVGASADFGALDADPATTVSGPVSGKRIMQLLTQTS